VATKAQADLQNVAVKAQADLQNVASKAQSELKDLQEALSYPVANSASTTSETTATSISQNVLDTSSTATLVAQPSESPPMKEKQTPDLAINTDDADATTPTQSPLLLPTSPTSTFFTRLQASLPPNLVTAVQKTIPDLKQAQTNFVSTVQTVQASVQATTTEQLKQAQSNLDSLNFAQIRTDLTAEFQRVQGITRAQAEEYVQKTDGLLREAVQGANEFFKDAVKVVPPEQAERDRAAGVAWDGSDLWAMDLTLGAGFNGFSGGDSGVSDKGKEKESQSQSQSYSTTAEVQTALATRTQALLRKLKHDPNVIRADPADEQDLKDMYKAWVESEITAKQDGIRSPEWTEKIVAALQDDMDGDALNNTMDELGTLMHYNCGCPKLSLMHSTGRYDKD
jgi:hypothetical protein